MFFLKVNLKISFKKANIRLVLKSAMHLHWQSKKIVAFAISKYLIIQDIFWTFWIFNFIKNTFTQIVTIEYTSPQVIKQQKSDFKSNLYKDVVYMLEKHNSTYF